jgi:hypothetical protein
MYFEPKAIHTCFFRDFASIELKKRKQYTVHTAEQWDNIMKGSANNTSIVDVEQPMIKDYNTLFSSLKDPVPLSRSKGMWKVTTCKIIEYCDR